ncbi:hypothetical protein KBD81_02075 [Candidatus Woesebacteria bacterium]|nr:hypothetical protein [Candidatus Woesebacteria bacterium]
MNEIRTARVERRPIFYPILGNPTNRVVLLSTGILQTAGEVPFEQQALALRHFTQLGLIEPIRLETTAVFMDAVKMEIESFSAQGGWINRSGDWDFGETACSMLSLEQLAQLQSQSMLVLKAAGHKITYIKPDFLNDMRKWIHTKGSPEYIVGSHDIPVAPVMTDIANRLTRLAKGDPRLAFSNGTKSTDIWSELLIPPSTIVNGIFSEHATFAFSRVNTF